MAKVKEKNRPYYWVNDLCTFYWEIVGPDGNVHEYVRKTCNDDNRHRAVRKARNLNRQRGLLAPANL